MLQNAVYSVGWLGSQPIISISLLRYLVKSDVAALYASQFFIRLWCIAAFLIAFIYKILSLQHPIKNSPHELAQPFRFSFSLVFTCAIFEFIQLALTIHAVTIVQNISQPITVSFITQLFTNYSEPSFVVGSTTSLPIQYFVHSSQWLQSIYSKIGQYSFPGTAFQNKYLSVKKSFDWQPLVMVICAAASHTLGIWMFKVLSMKMHQTQKAFIDRVSWSNYIADEPDKITYSLCVVNSLFSKYFEAQLRIHCETNSMQIDGLSQKELRSLIKDYFDNHLTYSFQYMEQFKIFNFNKEAIDDPAIYKEEDTLLRRLIREKIYEIQLEHQRYKELFGSDKYLNLQFEILFEDYGIHEYIWDDETPYIQLIISFFEGIFCFCAAFYNHEYDDLFSNGYYVSMSHVSYYVWITIFLGVFQLLKIFSFKVMFLWNVQTYFFSGIFTELIVVYITMLWIEPVGYLQVLGLILSYSIMCVLYRSAEKVRDQKNKLFYLSFITFLIRVQKFTVREGSQIIQMMSLCAERLSLNEFLNVLAQILCTHGIVSYDQLRQIKFSHFGESPFFQFQIPFIFQSQLRYENNIEDPYLPEFDDEHLLREEDKQTKFERYVIDSKYENEKQSVKDEVKQQVMEIRKLNKSKILQSNIQQSRIVQIDDHQE
ncbi:unnamed protein product (macronuclear) [Paramecium tetraurelia]|uniref:Transmembrane protein n=2 Tax=Paramecium tetraurelia TaxID=5888 RepID=A0BBN4_PARTE|nr:uncharacterized protein GSPATT00000386001 [Paramecium tetraurelia]CAK55951.1 unnamed protein product [Paramecium tetraurelia]|eukprot:XP_001423349.1 hypothetical protein (macronuclear) [Paramecium tetraurelia strain d4-2]